MTDKEKAALADCMVVWNPAWASLMKLGNISVDDAKLLDKPLPNPANYRNKNLETEEAARRDRLSRSLYRYYENKRK